MPNDDTQTQPVVDAQIVGDESSEPAITDEDLGIKKSGDKGTNEQRTTDTKPDDNAAQVLLDLETLIKTNLGNIDRGKAELKKLREMLTSALENDETYRLHNDEAKKAAKQKSSTKAQILSLPANKQLLDKVRGIAADVKEAEEALSDYLREYGRMSGTNEIETDDGDVREIVYVAKLVKKSGRGQY